jgi:hypothetical protein
MRLTALALMLLAINATCVIFLTICAVKKWDETKLWAVSAFLFAVALVVNVLGVTL